MVWFQVDDGMWSHPKMLGLSDGAGWLWVRAGAYCAQHLTDGVVPPAALRILAASDGDVAELVNAGLWEIAPEGHTFHDWDVYQRTREKVEADRAAARERQAKSRARKGHTDGNDVTHSVSHTVTSPVTNGVSHATRTEPNRAEPTLLQDMLIADATSAPDIGLAFAEFWSAYPRKVGKAAAKKAWAQAVKRAPANVITAACFQMANDPNLPTDRSLIPHPTTWLNRDGWEDEPYPEPVDAKPPSASRMFATLATTQLEVVK